MKIRMFKEMGVLKRLLWVWETICYGIMLGYALKSTFYEVTAVDNRVVIFCVPTVLFMLTFGDAVYADKIRWSQFRPHQWIVPLLIFIGCSIYGVFNSYFISSMAAGFLITYVLIILIAVSSRNNKEMENILSDDVSKNE